MNSQGNFLWTIEINITGDRMLLVNVQRRSSIRWLRNISFSQLLDVATHFAGEILRELSDYGVNLN